MAAYSNVTPESWEQGDDATAASLVTPESWEQVEGAGGGTTNANLINSNLLAGRLLSGLKG